MIVTLTGASGTGKTTLAKRLLTKLNGARMLTSFTTRAARPSDLPGEYEYLSREALERMRADGRFQWTTDLSGTSYGTTTESLRTALEDDGSASIMILVPETLPKLYAFADSLGKRDCIRSFFLLSPPTDVLRERMVSRGDDAASIERRLADCAEWEHVARVSDVPYDYIEDNDSLDEKLMRIVANLAV